MDASRGVGSHTRALGKENMRSCLCFYKVTMSALGRMSFRVLKWNQGDKWGDCLEILARDHVLHQGVGNTAGEKHVTEIKTDCSAD